jgi:hypothetical protein
MENILNRSQPALIAAADHLLNLVDRVMERHLNNAQSRCWTGTAIEGCRRSLIPSYSEVGQQTSLHHRLSVAY